MTIIYRILCLLGGYCFGMIQTSYIYGRMNGIDIREHGSGNAGTTNALRVLGKKAGIIVFFGDLLKAVLATVIARLIFNNICPENVYMYIAYTGLGVVLGHNFPFYLKFRGGKGIAATGGVIVGFLDPIMILSAAIVFFGLCILTKYVSMASICLVTMFFVEYTVFALKGNYSFVMDNPDSKAAMIESIIIVGFMTVMAIYRHKANIIRLINHEENKLFSGKKKESDN
ncbi:MAG: glycerol-3-phosphate 1-O-acyltransferase PlsY [Lachnospiraceae bacterium]|nr:glycerol-3-phosphate 1-O-acyltransferase PlsY [Lachnospiraceae bacterium]